jgi:hypothetical protein
MVADIKIGICHFKFCSCDLGSAQAKKWQSLPEVISAFALARKKKIEKALADSGVSPRFRTKRISDLSDSPALQQTCIEYIDAWAEHKAK